MLTNIAKLLPFALLTALSFNLTAEIYKDSDGNYTMVSSNGDKVIITPSNKVIYNGNDVAECSGKNQVFTYDNAVISCRGSNISVTANAVFSLQDGKLSVVDGTKIETKHLSSVKRKSGRGSSISIIERDRESIRVDGNNIIIEDGEDVVSLNANKGRIHIQDSKDDLTLDKQESVQNNNDALVIQDGNDVIAVDGNNSKITIKDSQDSLTINSEENIKNNNSRIFIQDGNDTVSVNGNSGEINIKDSQDEITLNQGSNTSGSAKIAINSGTNSIYIYEDVVKDLGAKKVGDDVIIEMNNDVLFDFDSFEISDSADATLKKIAFLIGKDRKGSIVVSGHTDSFGTKSYNQKLSSRRASTVANWLITNAKLSSDEVISKGFGEDYPIARNIDANGDDFPAGREKNRRVEIAIQTVKKDPTYLLNPRKTILEAADLARQGSEIAVEGARVGVAGAAAGAQGAAIGINGALQGLAAAANGLNQAREALDN